MPQSSRVTHNWSDKNRIILCLLQIYEPKFIAPIWSHIFRAELSVEGFSGDIPPKRLTAQFHDIKNGAKGYEFYRSIADASQNVLHRKYARYLDEIETAIRTLKLRVKKRRSVPLSPPVRQSLNRRRVMTRTSIPLTAVSTPSPEPDHGTSTRLDLQRFIHRPNLYKDSTAFLPFKARSQRTVHQDARPIFPKLTITVDKKGNTMAKHPILLYRATNTITNYCSRKYTDPLRVVSPPPEFGTQEYRDRVQPHLEEHEVYPSPFISFWQNPRNAVRKVERERSKNMDVKMFLVIFAFNDLHEDAYERFGDGSGPHLVRRLFKAGEVSNLADGYKGTGEVCKQCEFSAELTNFFSGFVMPISHANL